MKCDLDNAPQNVNLRCIEVKISRPEKKLKRKELNTELEEFFPLFSWLHQFLRCFKFFLFQFPLRREIHF